jgi:hypothetical protein
MDVPHITVDSYAGYKGQATPQAFTIDGVHLLVMDVIERWDSDTYSYFRIRASDQQRYVLRYCFDQEDWELVMQERVAEK